MFSVVFGRGTTVDEAQQEARRFEVNDWLAFEDVSTNAADIHGMSAALLHNLLVPGEPASPDMEGS